MTEFEIGYEDGRADYFARHGILRGIKLLVIEWVPETLAAEFTAYKV